MGTIRNLGYSSSEEGRGLEDGKMQLRLALDQLNLQEAAIREAKRANPE